MQIDLGKMRFTWRGTYDPQLTYHHDDVVFFNNSSYIVISPHPIHGLPPDHPEASQSWQLMAAGITIHGHQEGILVRDKSHYATLPAGRSGEVLQSQGAGLLPAWVSSNNEPNRVIGIANSDGVASSKSGNGVIMADGTLRIWGENLEGGFGIQSAIPCSPYYVATPQTPWGNTPVRKWHHTFDTNICLLSDGRVFAWGNNRSGCLGLDIIDLILVPTQVPIPDGVKIVDFSTSYDGSKVSYGYTLFLSEDGRIFSAGTNLRHYSRISAPLKYSVGIVPSDKTWVAIKVTGSELNRVFGLDNQGKIYTWGAGGRSGLARNQKTNETMHAIPLSASCRSFAVTVDTVTRGRDHDCCGALIALLEDGRVELLGNHGTTSYDGNGRSNERFGSENVRVWTWGGQRAAFLVQKSDHTLWALGCNSAKQFPCMDLFLSRNPEKLPVPGDSPVIQVMPMGSNDQYSLALLTQDGSVFVSGYNTYNNLGYGDVKDSLSFKKLFFPSQRVTTLSSLYRDKWQSLALCTESGRYYQTGIGPAIVSSAHGYDPRSATEQIRVFGSSPVMTHIPF